MCSPPSQIASMSLRAILAPKLTLFDVYIEDSDWWTLMFAMWIASGCSDCSLVCSKIAFGPTKTSVTELVKYVPSRPT